MKKEFLKVFKKRKNKYKYNRPKTVNRFWGLAARFEQCHTKRIKNKK